MGCSRGLSVPFPQSPQERLSSILRILTSHFRDTCRLEHQISRPQVNMIIYARVEGGSPLPPSQTDGTSSAIKIAPIKRCRAARTPTISIDKLALLGFKPEQSRVTSVGWTPTFSVCTCLKPKSSETLFCAPYAKDGGAPSSKDLQREFPLPVLQPLSPTVRTPCCSFWILPVQLPA